MTTEAMLRELVSAMQVVQISEKYGPGFNESLGETAHNFLRTHGPALVEAVRGHVRYEAVRKMSPPLFQKVFNESLRKGIPFDHLIDVWAYNNGYASVIDQARAEGGE